MKLALDASGLDAADMAAELGVTTQTIHNYLRGDREPILGVIKIWAQICEVPWQWVTTGELPDNDDQSGEDVSAAVTLRYLRDIRLQTMPVSLLKLAA